MLSSAWQLGCSISPQSSVPARATLSSQRCISPSLLSFHHTPTSHILTHDTSHTLPQHISHPHMHTSHTLSHAHISHPLTCTHLTPSHAYISHPPTTHLTPSHMHTSHTLPQHISHPHRWRGRMQVVLHSTYFHIFIIILVVTDAVVVLCELLLDLGAFSKCMGGREEGWREGSGKWEGMRGWEEGRRGRDM